MKDGRPPVEGVILRETETGVELRTLIKGAKDQIAGTAETTFLKSNIKRIERMPAEERRIAIARSEAFSNRTMRIYEALANLRLESVTLQGKPGYRTRTQHFELVSTCDEQFVREMAHYLEEMFTAYQGNFGIKDETRPRIPVYVLVNRQEYSAFQKARLGMVVENPAYYSPRENYIAACNLAPKELIADVRAKVKAAEREWRAYEDKIKDAGRDITKQVREVRKKINAEAAKAKRIIQRRNPANLAAELRRVDEWKRKELRKLKGREKDARDKLKVEKVKSREAMRKNRAIIVHNNRVLADRNEQMFETLFHEGFHAFSHNFLWENGRRQLVPRWLEEGLACYYEKSVVEAGYLIHGGANSARAKRLRDAQSAGKRIPLAKVVGGTAHDFIVAAGASGEHQGLYYAHSWAIVDYMMGRISPKRMQAYVRAVNRGVDGKKAFEAMMGMPMNRVDGAVYAHLAKVR
jgi:hypothetical protein